MTLSCGVIRARQNGRALLQACTREPTQRQRLAVGAPNFLWAIKPLHPYVLWVLFREGSPFYAYLFVHTNNDKPKP